MKSFRTPSQTRVVFMGSPEFAVPGLLGLTEAGYDVRLVVSQPDRPSGRGRKLASPPVAARAKALGLALHQPSSLRSEESREPIHDSRPDLIIVAAFGLILPLSVLDIPAQGCINIHASLLPRHRGAAPIQAAILAGDGQTGITLMRMDAGLDTGDIIRTRALPIDDGMDTPTLEQKLSLIGRDLLVETLPAWINDEITPTRQDERLATYASKISRGDASLNWDQSAEICARAVRAYRGWPNAYSRWNGQVLQILEAEISEGAAPDVETGTVVPDPLASRLPAVVTGQGLLRLLRVRLEGRSPVSGRELINGYPQIIGAVLRQ